MIAGNLELAEMIQSYKPEDIGKEERRLIRRSEWYNCEGKRSKKGNDCQSVELELTVASCSLLCFLSSLFNYHLEIIYNYFKGIQCLSNMKLNITHNIS